MANDKSNDKKSYVMYKSWSYMILAISDNQAGKLFKAICNYQIGQQVQIDDDLLGGMFEMFKASFELDDSKYRDRCEKNAISGSKGGKAKAENASKRKQTLANANDSKQSVANLADKDMDTDIDTDTDTDMGIDTDIDNDTEKEKETDTETDTDKGVVSSASVSASASSLSECGIMEICMREHIDCSAIDVMNYWVEMKHNGWKDGKGNPIKSIGAHFRNWLKRNKRAGEPHFTESEIWKNYQEYKQETDNDSPVASASLPANVPKTEEELLEICKREHIKCNGNDIEYYFYEMVQKDWKDSNGDPIRSVPAHFRDWLKRNADTTIDFCLSEKDDRWVEDVLSTITYYNLKGDLYAKSEICICIGGDNEKIHTIEELIDMLNDHSFGEQADILSRALYNTSSVSSYPTTIGELKRLCEKENIVNAGWYMKDYIEEMNANGWKDENGSPIKSVGTHFREWLKRNEEEWDNSFNSQE